MCYYTITTDLQNKQGHTQAIMIINADDEESAKREYIKTFNLPEFTVTEGITIDNEFSGLITSPFRKLLAKYKSGNADATLVSYSNSIHTKFEE